MTAQPAEPSAARPWAPDPVRQRLADYSIEDVLILEDEAPRLELEDGVLHVVPSPTIGHQKTSALLWMWLHRSAPPEFEASLGVGVVIDHINTLEPDVLLLHAPAQKAHHYIDPEDVVLAVEVVSPGTKRRDRFQKPAAYAAAGVRHYWRIEQNPVHVYAYELGPAGSYELIGDSDTELVLPRPFEIRLPIAAITP